MAQITEWEFTADIASRINGILTARPDLPFKEARAEQRGKGSTKRRDISLIGRNGNPVLTGEVKMPDSPEGRTPFHGTVVEDAHRKADAVGADFNFTWNINRLVLWNTHESGKAVSERAIEHFYVLPAPISDGDDVLQPQVRAQIDDFLVKFLDRLTGLLSGDQPMLLLPLDEKFIVVYEAGLERPVAQTLDKLSELYETSVRFKLQLDSWMRDEQGWVLSSDEQAIRENLERATKFSCYVFANKIVFYKALRKRYARMRQFRVPRSITTGEDLRVHLSALFAHAIQFTGDYETVFHGGFGDQLPCLNDSAVDSWRELSEQTDSFDFTQLTHEIIGQIFERLLSTEERHKFGQHYTRTEVVDLINAFCIRNPEDSVLDPACGGGTFLVRAYALKRALSGGKLQHRELIRQLHGFDISAYPVHLTTINLVTRDLIDDGNYPLVARRDFFRVRRGDTPFSIPFNGRGGQMIQEPILYVNAVVGNPPYIRQEAINEYYGAAYKNYLKNEIAKKEAPGAKLRGRSDIHVYFFPHAATFIENGGYLGLLTSSSWLDTEYGFRLQKYLLDNFEIVAIFESSIEPWFTGARVSTAATILRRQTDETKRKENFVRFVRIQQELSDMLAGCEGDDERRLFFQRLRDHIEQLRDDEETTTWRVRTIRQGDLYALGRLPFKVEEDEDEIEAGRREERTGPMGTEGDSLTPNEYTGYKWGIFLHAPEIYFKLVARAGTTLIPLGRLSRVRYGIKSGADDFFYPRDITDEELKRLSNPREFKKIHGIRPSDTERVRVVRAPDGSIHKIEAKYLEPEVHSIMGLDSVRIQRKRLERSAVLVNRPKGSLEGTHLLKYIQWGEREGHDETKTIKDRVDQGRLWYDIVPEERGPVLWSKSHQYRHIAFMNAERYVANCRMYDVFPHAGIEPDLLCAVLNSTVVALTKSLFGRFVGREGALDTEVLDTNMMLVPNPALANDTIATRLRAALSSMSQREALPMVADDGTSTDLSGELALADRQDLDDAVLEIMGISSPQERSELRSQLYEQLTKFYREIRETELKMQKHRAASARQGKITAQSLADEIWEAWSDRPQARLLSEFVPANTECQTIALPAGRLKPVFGDMFNPNSLQYGREFVQLGTQERVEYVMVLAHGGVSGSIRIPVASSACAVALQKFQLQEETISHRFQEAAAGYAADEQMQTRIIRELWRRARKRQ